jgi:uncharacterized protein YdgA (DUF945 family)
MKRILLIVGIVAGLLVIALAVAPFWLGMQTEAAFNQAMKTVANRSGLPDADTEISRGWLSSTATNRFSLPGAAIAVEASHRIEHGPLPLSRLLAGEFAPGLARIESTLKMTPGKETPAELASLLKALPPVAIVTTLDLSGDGASEISVPGGTRKFGDEQLKWSSANGAMRFDRDLKKIRADVTLPSFQYESGTGTLVVNNTAVSSDVYEGTAGYMFGRNSLSVSKVTMAPLMEISDIRLGAIIQPQGKFATMKLTYGVKQMTLGKDNYGPGTLNIAIRNLDAATLKQFEDELNKINARTMPDEQKQMMVAGKLMEFAGKLTRDNPEIEVTTLSVTAPGGELKGSAKFVIQGSEQDLSANPMLILTAIKGSAELTMPESLAKAMVMPQIQRDLALLQQEGKLSREEAANLSPETIDQIAEQAYPGYLSGSGFARWFVREDGVLKFSLSVNRGQVVVNGVPMTGGSR